MIRIWTLFDKGTGLFTGSTFSTTDEKLLAQNTPADHAVIEGRFDHLSQRVDVNTGKVIDYQPPQPSTDHEWNADTKRWVLNADVVAKQQAAATARSRIALLESQQARPLRELALDPYSADAKARISAIEAEIASLRISLT